MESNVLADDEADHTIIHTNNSACEGGEGNNVQIQQDIADNEPVQHVNNNNVFEGDDGEDIADDDMDCGVADDSTCTLCTDADGSDTCIADDETDCNVPDGNALEADKGDITDSETYIVSDENTFEGVDTLIQQQYIENLEEQLAQSEYELCEVELKCTLLESKNAKLENELQEQKVQHQNCIQELQLIGGAYAASYARESHVSSVLNSVKFGVESLRGNDEKTNFYTGLPSYNAFEALCDILLPALDSQVPSRQHHLIDELFLTLTKLRLGLLHKDLAFRINLTESAV